MALAFCSEQEVLAALPSLKHPNINLTSTSEKYSFIKSSPSETYNPLQMKGFQKHNNEYIIII